MTGLEWLVVGAGVAGIAWVNWYCFAADARPATPSDDGPGPEETP